MAIKVQKNKKVEPTQPKKELTESQEAEVHTHETQQTSSIDQEQTSPSVQSNLDLSGFLTQMTQMMSQQWEMMKMMDERMKKLEEQNATKAVEGEVVKEPEVVVPLNEDNVATYDRENEEWYSEVINKVWKILYVTAQAPVMRWMQDAAPMMEPVCERRRVWNMVVSDTKYFNSENEAKAYLENLRKKGTILPWAKIIACYI